MFERSLVKCMNSKVVPWISGVNKALDILSYEHDIMLCTKRNNLNTQHQH